VPIKYGYKLHALMMQAGIAVTGTWRMRRVRPSFHKQHTGRIPSKRWSLHW